MQQGLDMRKAKYSLFAFFARFIVARVLTLGYESFWHDEIFTLDAISGSWSRVLEKLVHVYDHPPLYFLALKVWAALAGNSEVALRAFSALCGIGGYSFAVWWLYRRHGALVAIVASALFLSHPLLAMHLESARMYASLFLLSASFLPTLLDVITSERRHGFYALTALTALTAALALTHYMGLLFLVGCLLGIWISDADSNRKKSCSLHIAAGLLAFLLSWGQVMAGHFLGKHGTSWINDVWGSGINPRLIARTLFEFVGVQTQEGYSIVPRVGAFVLFVAAIGMMLPAFISLLRKRNPEVVVLACATCFPASILILLSPVMQALQTRYVLPSLVAFVFLISILAKDVLRDTAARKLQIRAVTIFAILAGIPASVTLGYYSGNRNIERWDKAIPALARDIQPNDKVIFLPAIQRVDFAYFARDVPLQAAQLIDAPDPATDGDARRELGHAQGRAADGRIFVLSHHAHLFDPDGSFVGGIQEELGSPSVTPLPGRNWELLTFQRK